MRCEEIRTGADVTDDDLHRVAGYAIRYGTPYEVNDRYGPFTETINRAACADTLANDDQVLLVEHQGMPLARKSSGTLRMAEDPKGLRIEADLSKRSHLHNDLAEALRRKDVQGMSIGFRVPEGGDKWNAAGDVRHINKLDLFEVTATGSPCSPTTSLGMRSTVIEDEDALDEARALLEGLRAYLADVKEDLPEEHRALNKQDAATLSDSLAHLHHASGHVAIANLALSHLSDCLDRACGNVGNMLPDDVEDETNDEASARATEEAEELRQRQIQRLAIRQRKAKLRLSV
jgi:uncharacterized protein